MELVLSIILINNRSLIKKHEFASFPAAAHTIIDLMRYTTADSHLLLESLGKNEFVKY